MKDPSQIWCRLEADGVQLSLKVVPRSSRVGPLGFINNSLKWGVRASAQDGAANSELIGSVAEAFQVSKQNVQIRQGRQARNKLVFVWIQGDEQIQLVLASILNAS